ncbi:MAG TPA: hypothetical protein PKE63_01640, partial [Lacibacter sp.]|nr:hypothetical protein [Lacibacter sp.]
QQAEAGILAKSLHVFRVHPVYRMKTGGRGFRMGAPRNAGANPPPGMVLPFYVQGATDSTKASIDILDSRKNLVRSFSTGGRDRLELKNGLNRFNWNLQYPGSEPAEGMVLWNGVPGAITAPPGTYYARVKVGKDSAEVAFMVMADPTYSITQADYEAQFELLRAIQKKFNDVQKGIKDIRALRTQVQDFVTRQGKDCPAEIREMANALTKELTAIEEALYQTKAKSSQDVLNYPIRLNDKLAGLFGVVNSGMNAPSQQARDVYADLGAQADVQLNRLKKIITDDVPKFNQLIRDKQLPVISVK